MLDIEKNSKVNLLNRIVVIGIILFLVLCVLAFIFNNNISGILSVIAILVLILSYLLNKMTAKRVISIIMIIIAFVLIIPCLLLFYKENYKKYDWNSVLLSNIISKPSSSYGEVIFNSNEYLSLNITRVSKMQFEEYVANCKSFGFANNVEESSSFFKAYNQYGDELLINYNEKNKKMTIKLKVPTLNWPDSELAKLIPKPDAKLGEIEQDDESIFVAYISDFTKEEYYNYVSACSKMGFNINSNNSLNKYSAQNNELYKILLEYIDEQVMKITVYEVEYNINIDVEYIEHAILNKYDIKVYVDDSYLGIINCGKKEEYNIPLTKGIHKIKFVNVDDENIFREEVINVLKNELFNYKILSTNNGIDIDTISPLIKEIKIISPTNGEYKTGQEIKIRVIFSENIKGIAPILNLKIGNSYVVATSTNPDGTLNYIDYNYVVKKEYGKVDIGSYTGGDLTDIAGNIAEIKTIANSGYQISIKVPEQNRALFAQQKFVASNKRTIEYWIYVPDISIVETYEKIPLVVALHMYGISSMKSLSSYSIMGYIKNKEIQPNAIVVAPLAYNNSKQINEFDTVSIIELIKEISKTYDINKNKISIAGHSMGARNALRIAKANPNYFSACVLFSWIESGAEEKRHDMQTLPMPTCKTKFVYEGLKSADYNRNIAISLSKKYSNISVESIPNTTHGTVIQAYKTTDILKWMIEQTR